MANQKRPFLASEESIGNVYTEVACPYCYERFFELIPGGAPVVEFAAHVASLSARLREHGMLCTAPTDYDSGWYVAVFYDAQGIPHPAYTRRAKIGGRLFECVLDDVFPTPDAKDKAWNRTLLS